MFASVAITIAITTFGLLLILDFIGIASLTFALIFAVIFMLIQWLIAPRIISFAFGLIPAAEAGYPQLEAYVAEIASKSRLKKPPKIYVSPHPMANAFAFGNIFTGKKIAVTAGLLNILSPDEIKAVIAHEIGHVKHKDIEILMALSVLPAIFYLIGRWAYYAGLFRGMYGWSSSREKTSSNLILLGLAVISLLIYFLLSIFTLWLSRTREYYADHHATITVEDGSYKLAKALVKLEIMNRRVVKEYGLSKSSLAFKCLFITDPEKAPYSISATYLDEYIYYLATRKITFGEKLKELFSTHPLTPKRIRYLIHGVK